MPKSSRLPSLPSRLALLLLIILASCAVTLAWAARPASANSSQVAIIQDDPHMQADPAGTLQKMRNLGVSTVRVMLRWVALAPHANSFRAPRHFNGANPADYSKSSWARYDAMARDAKAAGIRIDLDVLGGAPLWATGRGMPHISGYPFHNWEPSASAYGKFVRAVATRYSGNYDPNTNRIEKGNPADLPRINFWSVYNEPNYGPSLAPQALPGHKGVADSPRMYRSLLDQAYSALKATGHGRDTLLFGETAARGGLTFGDFNMMLPLVFFRGLYCVSGSYRPLRGTTARLMGCPTTAAGSRSFARHNPALFRAAGVSDHPYMRWFPPNNEENSYQPAHFSQIKRSYASLATIGNLTSGISRAMRAYRSGRRMPVWITEFGYVTNPPAHPTSKYPYHYASPATAAYYDNWAEYIAWRNRRIASFDQYILQDPPSGSGQGFPSGLIFSSGTPKPGLGAFRLPLYLPKTTASSRTTSLEVWGGARPIHFAQRPQAVVIQFQAKGTNRWVPLATQPVSSPEGYFDTHVRFPSSGSVRLQWTYPLGDPLLGPPGSTVHSRTVNVTVK